MEDIFKQHLNQSRGQIIICEIKNPLGRVNRQFDIAEEEISQLEYVSIEITPNKTQRKKFNEEINKELWVNVNRTTMLLTGTLKEKNGFAENLFEQIKYNNFLNLKSTECPESQRTHRQTLSTRKKKLQQAASCLRSSKAATKRKP